MFMKAPEAKATAQEEASGWGPRGPALQRAPEQNVFRAQEELSIIQKGPPSRPGAFSR